MFVQRERSWKKVSRMAFGTVVTLFTSGRVSLEAAVDMLVHTLGYRDRAMAYALLNAARSSC